MTWNTIISPADLAAHLGDPACLVVDCRFSLDDPAWGRQAYGSAHIPGAVYASLNDDLAGPRTGTNGRHPLPDPQRFNETLGRLGIGNGMQVVAYDQDTGMYASRLWWMLRWMGHDAVAVLDGGFANWAAEGRPTQSGEEHRAAAQFTGSPRRGMLLTAADVVALPPGARLVDARAPERYRGETEPLDRVAGHIPGAVNHFYKANLDERGMFRAPDALHADLTADLGDTPPERVICYCGSGVTACHNVLALEHAGLHGAKLYAGSWSEWSSDPARPIATCVA